MKKIKRIINMVLAFMLIIAISAFPVLGDEQSSLEAENDELQDEIEEQEEKLAEIKSSITDLEEYIDALEDQISEIESIISGYESEQAQIQAEIDALSEEIAQEEENLAEQYELMKLRIRYFYENGETSYLEIFFTSGSIAEILSEIQYTVELTSYDRAQMETIQALIDSIEEDKLEQETKYAEIEELKSAQESQEAILAEAKSEKETALAEAYDEEYEIEQLVADLEAEYEANKDRIDTIIAEYEAAQAAAEAAAQAAAEAAAAAAAAAAETSADDDSSSDSTSSDSTSSGSSSSGSSSYSYSGASMIWPLPSPYLADHITSYFGYRTTSVGSTNHKGIDIWAPSGTSIYAVLDGVVVMNGYSSSAGYYVIIYHGDGMYTHYYHQCQASPVAVDTVVTQGQVIGYVGSTGASTGNHLHFGISIGAIWSGFVDPAPYLGIS